jgi:pyruvate,water dikinase
MKNVIDRIKSFFGPSSEDGAGALSIKTVFRNFKEVLESNNRALEIIADMGEKLGGDYLFDINYIKSAYSELAGTVSNSLQNFDALTMNKYLKLHDVFNRVDSQIKRLIYDVTPSPGLTVLSFKDITWNMFRDVGGKNAALAEMTNYLKLNVPDGFVITTGGFDQFVEHNALQERIRSVQENSYPEERLLEELRNLIMTGTIPPDLDNAIGSAVEKIRDTFGRDCFLAVRSSAEEEDGEHSFAGQFETVLNVPLDEKLLKDAYKRVLASLFSPNSVAYQTALGYRVGDIKMAVGCLLMVDAVKSGVIYTIAPNGDREIMVINSTWGLGVPVVEGQTDADMFMVKKDIEPELLGTRSGAKEYMVVKREGGGVEKAKTPEGMAGEPSMNAEEVSELARQAVYIEKHFRRPLDIEWAIDKSGRLFILQARPLRGVDSARRDTVRQERTSGSRLVLMKDKGIVVQKGTGGGRVFLLRHPGEIDRFPKGSVLVSKYDSSNFVRIMPYVSAIITDVGAPTSHMASLCREFRVPTVVNTGDATSIFEHGQEITVTVDEEGATVYDGVVKELLRDNGRNSLKMEELYEYRKRRYVLRYISMLNLVDPLQDNFSPEGCRTLHDIIRFMHEKAVTELVVNAGRGNEIVKKHAAVKLDLPVPAGIVAIDIGGGLDVGEEAGKAVFEQILSVPLRAVVRGMMHPGVWHADAVSLKMGDFLSSMMRMPDLTADRSEYVGYNVAVVSGEYLNLSIRFGYHFTVLDCYCSENARNNHVYFRFIGGATDMVKRSRRVELISSVLKEFGFTVTTKGDLLIGRLANVNRDGMEGVLDQLGRLLAFTRQLDAVLNDDASVERFVKNFIEGRYAI